MSDNAAIVAILAILTFGYASCSAADVWHGIEKQKLEVQKEQKK